MAAVALLAIWSWRPLGSTGGIAPYVDPTLPQRERAIAAVDSLFQVAGILIDSLYQSENRALVAVATRGALVTPLRFEDGVCLGGENAWTAMRRLGIQLDAWYAADAGVRRIDIRTQQLTANASGWGWRRSCGRGGASVSLYRAQLDSLRANER